MAPPKTQGASKDLLFLGHLSCPRLVYLPDAQTKINFTTLQALFWLNPSDLVVMGAVQFL